MSELIRNVLFWLCFFIIKIKLIYTKVFECSKQAIGLCISGEDFSVTLSTGYINKTVVGGK